MGSNAIGQGLFCESAEAVMLRYRNAFYRSSNSILNTLHGPSELVQMKLLYSICVPIITYASDVVIFHDKEMESLHVAVNDAIRKIFSNNRWESIKVLRKSLRYLSVTEILARRKKNLSRVNLLMLVTELFCFST